MRPTFSISAAGKNITSDVSSRLVMLQLTDTVDETSDSLNIQLEDVQGTLALPASGARLEIAIGYDGQNQRMGAFVVDEVSIEGPPDIISIQASSTPFVSDRGGFGTASFSSRKSRSFEGKTIADIVATVAGECGLQPVVDKTLGAIVVPHIAQVSESDANLLLRLARSYGGVLKPADGRLVIAAEEGGQTTNGAALEATIRPSDVSRYTVRLGGKTQGVTKVRAVVQNYGTAATETVEAEVGDGQFIAPKGASEAELDTFYQRVLESGAASVETAKAAAKTTATRIERAKKSLSLSMPGTTAIAAGMVLNLSGFRSGISGRYKVISVTHTVSRSAFLTAISCEGA